MVNKAQSGQDLQSQCTQILVDLKKTGTISGFTKKKYFKHKNFDYEKQYLANFLIQTNDSKFINIHLSNSYRADRIKGFYYDIEGIKNHAPISEDIIASIALFPDK